MIGKKIIFFFMLLAFLLRVPLCFQSPEVLIPKAVSDDMFYYLCIARNIAKGAGVTADGENVTNGFHPIWAAILVPLFLILGDSPQALQWALVLMTLFSVLTAWFIYRIIRLSFSEAAALVAALFWLCNPYTVLVALAGVEAPVFVFMMSAASYCCLKLTLGQSRERAALRSWFWVGLLAGASVLARIDGAVLALLILLHSFSGGDRGGLLVRQRFFRSLSFVFGAVLLTAPWYIWSYLRTGFIFPTSGKAIYHQQHVIFWREHANSPAIAYAHAWLWQVLLNMRDALRSIMVLSGIGPLALAAAIAVCAVIVLVCRAKEREGFNKWAAGCGRFSFLFLYGMIVSLLYCAYLWYSQDWYYYSIFFVLCIFIGCIIAILDECCCKDFRAASRSILWTAVAACMVIFSCHRTLALWGHGIRGWQIDMYRAAIWVKEKMPKEERIGSFNSGILAYYCPQTVINLDGVVNGKAYRAITEGKIFSYLKEEKITCIMEAPLSLRFRMFQSPNAPPPGLVKLHAECSYPEAAARRNPVVVYKVADEV